MASEQARVVHLACDFLHSYLTRDGVLIRSDLPYAELTEGNVLTSDAVAGMLAKLRGRSFNQVLDELPKRDEGFPPNATAAPMWDSAVDHLKYVHVHGWEAARSDQATGDPQAAFGASLNLVSP